MLSVDEADGAGSLRNGSGVIRLNPFLVVKTGRGASPCQVILEVIWFRISAKLVLHTSLLCGEFDSGSERTLAAWIRHASRTRTSGFKFSDEKPLGTVAEG